MEKSEAKKPLVLIILKILEKYSDIDHPLKHEDIISLIEKDYGLSFKRKAIGNAIDILINQFDYDIEKVPGKGSYLNSRLIDESEMSFLSDAIYASRVKGKYANELVKKLASVFSDYKKNRFIHNHYSNELNKVDPGDFLYKIQTIQDAINDNKKIEFQYITYDENSKQYNKRGVHNYKVSPYFTVSDNNKHYLLCLNDNANNISSYRIEFMKDINVLDETLNKINKDFKISEFMNNQTYMFNDNTIEAEFILYSHDAIRMVKDWFKSNAKIDYDPSSSLIKAKIRSSEKGLLYWAMQFSDEVEIVSPQAFKNRFYAMISRAYRKNNTQNTVFDITKENVYSMLSEIMDTFISYTNIPHGTDLINAINENIKDYIPSYINKIEENTLYFTNKVKQNERLVVNIIDLVDSPNPSTYYNILEDINNKTNISKENEILVNLYVTENRDYFRERKINLNDHFIYRIKANKDEEIKNGQNSFKMKETIYYRWNAINKKQHYKNPRYLIAIMK